MKIGEIAIKAIHIGEVAAKALAIGATKVWEGTNEEYSEAIDVESDPYSYEETDKEIEQYEEPIEPIA